MRRSAAYLAVVLIVVAGVRPAQAASTPVINVNTFGIELCPQFVCGAAIFTGFLHGQVGGNHNALGTFTAALTHEPLPEPLNTAAITGGVFELRVGLRRIRGVVLPGGTLFNNGNNTYSVDAVLLITSGGSGTVTFQGLLNHNTFPPTIVGTISQ
jgi:hypothetical protein